MSETEAAGVVVAYPYPIVDAAVAEFLRQHYGGFERRWQPLSSGSGLHQVFLKREKLLEVGVRNIAPETSADLQETLVVFHFMQPNTDEDSDALLHAFLAWWPHDRAGMAPFRKPLVDKTPMTHLVKPGLIPLAQPERSASIDEWLQYRGRMQRQGQRIALARLAEISGKPLSTLKKRNAELNRKMNQTGSKGSDLDH